MIGFIIGVCIGYFCRPLVTLFFELIARLWARYKHDFIKWAAAAVQ
jgi:hypothetical protein